MSETVQSLMSWNEGQFEFRVGLLWPGPEVPASSTDFVLEEGMEPQRIIVDMTEQRAHGRHGAARAAQAEDRRRNRPRRKSRRCSSR